jgi:cyclohexyl-isocyanide hydratase
LGKEERVVVSGNRITGGGVTAGIDIALRIAEKLHGPAVAEEIRLAIEYGESPKGAPEEIRDAVLRRLAPMKQQRRRAVDEAARKLFS